MEFFFLKIVSFTVNPFVIDDLLLNLSGFGWERLSLIKPIYALSKERCGYSCLCLFKMSIKIAASEIHWFQVPLVSGVREGG